MRKAVFAVGLSAVFSTLSPTQQWAEVDLASALTHYARVERELRARDVSHLSPEQQQARSRVLDLLRSYRERGIFGINRDFPNQREPYFIDGTDRRCAVAALLDGTGFGDLSLRIAAERNHAWVVELSDMPELGRWLDIHGLSLAEAARIQMSCSTPPPPPPPPHPSGPGVAPLGIPNYVPPIDPSTADRDVSPSNTGGVSAPTGGRNGTVGVQPRTAVAAVSGVSAGRGMPVSQLGAESWLTWWGWNRRVFLTPRTWEATAPRTGNTVSNPLEQAREASIPILRQGLKNSDVRVRASAALALGRVAGAQAVTELKQLLDDPSLWVRQTAVLALGASESPSAVYTLLRIAHGTDDPGAFSRPLALVALGLAVRSEGAASMAPLVERLLKESSPGEKETVATAALAFAKLTETIDLHDALRAITKDDRESGLLRARAAESLIGAADRETIADLTRALSARNLDLRRSTALALGQADHDLALPALLTAFEMEKELLTKTFALVAIGRHGGPNARDFLIEQVQSGRKPLRAWAGLGLGILSRSEQQPKALAAIRAGWRHEHNHDLRGTWLVAMGLARDPDSIDLLVTAFRESQSSIVRASAVEGLALSGSDRALPILRKALTADSSPYVRGVTADALAHVGLPTDADLLLKALQNENDPELRLRLATAIGALGTDNALRALQEIHEQTDDDPALRAAVLQALGSLLARNPERAMPKLSSLANYTLFPSWLAWALTHDV